jgi:hypothetical protein
MPPVNLKRALVRALRSTKTEAGAKALVSVFFFSSSLHGLATEGPAPKPLLAALHCLCPTALAFLPGSKPTACTRRQPHLCEGMTLAQVDGGAPAARYSGSAAGAGGQRDRRTRTVLAASCWRSSPAKHFGAGGARLGRASRVATRPPPPAA